MRKSPSTSTLSSNKVAPEESASSTEDKSSDRELCPPSRSLSGWYAQHEAKEHLTALAEKLAGEEDEVTTSFTYVRDSKHEVERRPYQLKDKIKYVNSEEKVWYTLEPGVMRRPEYSSDESVSRLLFPAWLSRWYFNCYRGSRLKKMIDVLSPVLFISSEAIFWAAIELPEHPLCPWFGLLSVVLAFSVMLNAVPDFSYPILSMAWSSFEFRYLIPQVIPVVYALGLGLQWDWRFSTIASYAFWCTLYNYSLDGHPLKTNRTKVRRAFFICAAFLSAFVYCRLGLILQLSSYEGTQVDAIQLWGIPVRPRVFASNALFTATIFSLRYTANGFYATNRFMLIRCPIRFKRVTGDSPEKVRKREEEVAAQKRQHKRKSDGREGTSNGAPVDRKSQIADALSSSSFSKPSPLLQTTAASSSPAIDSSTRFEQQSSGILSLATSNRSQQADPVGGNLVPPLDNIRQLIAPKKRYLIIADESISYFDRSFVMEAEKDLLLVLTQKGPLARDPYKETILGLRKFLDGSRTLMHALCVVTTMLSLSTVIWDPGFEFRVTSLALSLSIFCAMWLRYANVIIFYKLLFYFETWYLLYLGITFLIFSGVLLRWDSRLLPVIGVICMYIGIVPFADCFFGDLFLRRTYSYVVFGHFLVQLWALVYLTESYARDPHKLETVRILNSTWSWTAGSYTLDTLLTIVVFTIRTLVSTIYWPNEFIVLTSSISSITGSGRRAKKKSARGDGTVQPSGGSKKRVVATAASKELRASIDSKGAEGERFISSSPGKIDGRRALPPLPSPKAVLPNTPLTPSSLTLDGPGERGAATTRQGLGSALQPGIS